MTSRSCFGKRRDLASEHFLGDLRVALRLGLPDAGDDRKAGFERRLGTEAHGLVGLTEVLAALGMADERPLDPELQQHRRRHLAREGPFELPVHVLGVDADVAFGAEALDRRLEGHERRADDDVDVRERSPKRLIWAANSRAWCAPLNIFQLPAISTGRDLTLGSLAGDGHRALGAALSHARVVLARVVAACAGSGRLRVQRIGRLAGPHVGCRDGRAPAGHRPSRGRHRRNADARRRRCRLVSGRKRRRVGPLARAAVRRRRYPSSARRHPARVERGARAGPGHRRRGAQQPRRVRRVCVAGGRPRAGGLPLERIGSSRERRRGGFPARSPLRGRIAALPRARRARRPDPPRAQGDRPALGRHRRRPARRRDVPDREVLVASRRAMHGWRSSTSVAATSGREYGISRAANGTISRSTSREPSSSRTGGRTPRLCSS